MKIRLTVTHINNDPVKSEISATGTGDAVKAHDRAWKKLVKEVYNQRPDAINIRYTSHKEKFNEWEGTTWDFIGEYSN